MVASLGAQGLLASPQAQQASLSQSRDTHSQPAGGIPAGQVTQGSPPSHQTQLSPSLSYPQLLLCLLQTSSVHKRHNKRSHHKYFCQPSTPSQDSFCRRKRTPHKLVIRVSGSEGARASRSTVMPGLGPAPTGPLVAVTHPGLASGSPVALLLCTAHLGLVSAPLQRDLGVGM